MWKPLQAKRIGGAPNIHRALWSVSIRTSTRDLSRIGEFWTAGCFALTR